MIILSNAFALSMLPRLPARPYIEELTLGGARAALSEGFISAVGHAETAALFTEVLGINVRFNRTTISLTEMDLLVVGQYKGPRLSEGATTLPAGATIIWLRVRDF